MGYIKDIEYNKELEQYQIYLVMENGYEGWELPTKKYKNKKDST